MDEITLVQELLASDPDPAETVLAHARQLLDDDFDSSVARRSTHRIVSIGRFVTARQIVPILAAAALIAAAVVLPLTIYHSTPADHGEAFSGLRMQLVSSDTSPFRSVGTDPGAFYLQCVTDATCYGTSGASPIGGSPVIYRTDDGGSTWKATAPLPHLLDAPLACTSATDCLVAVTNIPGPGKSLPNALPNALPIASTTNGGMNWVASSLVLPRHLAGASIQEVACATAQRCVVYVTVSYNTSKKSQGAFFTTSDAGLNWTEAAPVTGIADNDVSTISCATNGDCIGVVVSGSVPTFSLSTISSTDFGANWIGQPSVPITSAGGDITTCGDTQHCYFVYVPRVGKNVSVARTEDGGRTWTVSTEPVGWGNDYFGLSCPTGTDCYVSTAHNVRALLDHPRIETTKDGGATWSTVGLPKVHGSALGFVGPLSCPTVDGCLGVAAFPNQAASLLVSSLPATKRLSQ